MRHLLHAGVPALAAVALTAAPCAADTVSLRPVADATLIQPSDGNQYALGAAYNIYCGRVGVNGGGTLRRALVRFDLSSIPAGSRILSVSYRSYMSQTSSGSHNCALHRMLEPWGEGTSFAFGGGGTAPEANDATWVHRFWPGNAWSAPGGVFVPSPSAVRAVAGAGSYTWSTTAALVADVQAWVNGPAQNFGWVMVGNESTLETAKRFESRESGDAARHPTITITYSPPTAPPGDLNGDSRVDGADIGVLLSAWGQAGGPADLDGDGIVGGADLTVVLANWST
jgi:hypothetical protein